MHVLDVVKVAFQAFELLVDIIAQRLGDVDVMSGKIDLH